MGYTHVDQWGDHKPKVRACRKDGRITWLSGKRCIAGTVDSDTYGFHGLRHTYGVEAAVAACSDAHGAALPGHGPESFARYRRQAARLTLSDDGAELIAALRERRAGTSPEQEVSNDCLNVSNSTASSAPARGERLSPSTLCDGTAFPDRTGDLQSHNLAL